MQRDLITLQVGNYANYVGAHYWNTQDELLGYAESAEWAPYTACIDPDVQYVLSDGRQGAVTYRPKVLMMDLSGSLGGVSLSTSTAAAADDEAAAATVTTWGGAVEVHRSAPVAKSAFVCRLEEQAEDWRDGDEDEDDDAREALQERQQSALKAAVRELDADGAADAPAEGGAAVPARASFWTDFLKAELLPRSIFTLTGAWHGVADFSGWGSGRAALNREGREAAMDIVRRFAEQCDGLGGFQVFGEDVGGWGSVAVDMLEELREEYPGRQVLYFSVRPPAEADDGDSGGFSSLQRTKRSLNEALALSSISSLVDLYVPITPPPCGAGSSLHYQLSSQYQTSAALAAALHGATLPYRLRAGTPSALGEPLGTLSLPALTRLLASRGGANLASLRVLLPAPHLPRGQSPHGLEQRDGRVHHAAAGGTAGPGAGQGQRQGNGAEGGDDSAELQNMDEDMMDFTAGVRDVPLSCLAEIITLQGPRDRCGPVSTSAALASLDSVLLQRPRRCVQHRCVTPVPLPLPLTFPRGAWAPEVSHTGDIRGGPAGGANGDVATAPMLTKLVATSGFRKLAGHMRSAWHSAALGAAGRSMLQAWDVTAGEAAEVDEALQTIGGAYDMEDGEEDSDEDA